jgi:Fe-S-cluster containining protein
MQIKVQKILDAWAEEGRQFNSIDQVYAAVDNITAREKFACGKTNPCNGCCTQPIQMNKLEFIEALHYGRKIGFVTEDKIKYIIKEAIKRIKNPNKGKTNYCLLLDNKGRCGVYKKRPLVCRAYNVFGIPASKCHSQKGYVDDKHVYYNPELTALMVVIDHAFKDRKTLEQHIYDYSFGPGPVPILSGGSI